MAVSSDGEVAGSVSGGCVEGAVVSEALYILSGHQPARLVTFGYSDDQAFAVGLTCGAPPCLSNRSKGLVKYRWLRGAACVLTHDAKFDVLAIVAALATRVGYIGAMGSRRTHADRVGRLREAGVDDAGLARLMAPIGLDGRRRSATEADRFMPAGR